MGHHRHIEIWKAVPHCLMWCIWRERNARTFEEGERNIMALKLCFFALCLILCQLLINTLPFLFLSFFIIVLSDCNSLVSQVHA